MIYNQQQYIQDPNESQTSDQDNSIQNQSQRQFEKQSEKYNSMSMITIGFVLSLLFSIISYYVTYSVYQSSFIDRSSFSIQFQKSTIQIQKQLIQKNVNQEYLKCLTWQSQLMISCFQKIIWKYQNFIQIQKLSCLEKAKKIKTQFDQTMTKYKQKCDQLKLQSITKIKNQYSSIQVNKCNQKIKTLASTQQKILMILKKQYPLRLKKQQLISKVKPYFPTIEDLAILKPQTNFIIVTPAGRQQYLEILYKHLLKQKQFFFQWHLWIHTTDSSDIDYIKKLADQNQWIKLIQVPNFKFHHFNAYYKQDYLEKTLYLKLDDDTLWMDPNFIKKMFQSRFQLTNHFIVFSNIINSAIHSHVQQRLGVFKYPQLVEYDCTGNGWYTPSITAELHKQFISDIQNNNYDKWKSFKQWKALSHQRISINAFLYYSQTIKNIDDSPYVSDQITYSAFYPRLYKKPTTIIGDALSVHGAFFSQRLHFDVLNPQIIKKYQQLADNL